MQLKTEIGEMLRPLLVLVDLIRSDTEDEEFNGF